MDDAAPVRVFRGAGKVLHQRGGLPRRWQAVGQDLIEVAAIDVFQREVGAAVLFADLVDLDDVGVVETGRRLTRRK